MRFIRFSVFVVACWLFTFLFWVTFVACVDAPPYDHPPAARVVVSWDPLSCGDPHRVVVELEDDSGAEISSSTPCAIGGLALDAPWYGIYRGRIYSWSAGEPIRSVVPVRITVDEPIVRWIIATPP